MYTRSIVIAAGVTGLIWMATGPLKNVRADQEGSAEKPEGFVQIKPGDFKMGSKKEGEWVQDRRCSYEVPLNEALERECEEEERVIWGRGFYNDPGDLVATKRKSLSTAPSSRQAVDLGIRLCVSDF